MTVSHGTIPGRTISDLHRVLPSFFAAHYSIVIMLDSSQDVKSFINRNGGGEGISLQFFGRAAGISPTDIDIFFKGNYLHAFDEMYLAPERMVTRLEVQWSEQFTSDYVNFDQSIPEFVSHAMDRLNATRFVADGLAEITDKLT